MRKFENGGKPSGELWIPHNDGMEYIMQPIKGMEYNLQNAIRVIDDTTVRISETGDNGEV